MILALLMLAALVEKPDDHRWVKISYTDNIQLNEHIFGDMGTSDFEIDEWDYRSVKNEGYDRGYYSGDYQYPDNAMIEMSSKSSSIEET